jgi:glycine cleavage system H protein
MHVPEDLYYHPGHAWAKIGGDTATIGITDHAQKELGDVVFVELPKVGRKVGLGEVFGSVESSKSVSELISPVSGEVAAVNTSLEASPELLNDDPYGGGWMIRVKLDPGFDLSKLLSAEVYRKRIS